ncbi:hypothetical protein LguiA_010926 [Lonicera macranthoides]
MLSANMYFSIQHEPYLPFMVSTSHLRGTLVSSIVKENDAIRRRRALKRVDRELYKGNFKSALSLVKHLQGKPGGLRGFGAAKQVPQRISSLDELKLSEIETSYIQSLLNSIMDSVNSSIQFTLSEEVPSLEPESSMHSKIYDSHSEDRLMCLQHEAGHFLVGYLLGVLPKGYSVFSVENLKPDGGRVEFPGFEFLSEIGTGRRPKYKFNRRKLCDRASKCKLSLKNLNRFLCVILGGLIAEYLVFGYAEGFHSDVEKLDRVLKWLDFTEEEAESQVKWAALNTVLILSRHHEARSRLAEAMGLGRSVGFCIDTIENSLNDKEI